MLNTRKKALTILIWIYAERQQTEDKVLEIPIDISINASDRIVMVKDPCPAPCDPCNRCATPAPKCVAVQICVPPCSTCPPKVTCKRCGEYVRYDFGKYAVDIYSNRNGTILVDYDA